jgi:hypothetical protein
MVNKKSKPIQPHHPSSSSSIIITALTSQSRASVHAQTTNHFSKGKNPRRDELEDLLPSFLDWIILLYYAIFHSDMTDWGFHWAPLITLLQSSTVHKMITIIYVLGCDRITSQRQNVPNCLELKMEIKGEEERRTHWIQVSNVQRKQQNA